MGSSFFLLVFPAIGFSQLTPAELSPRGKQLYANYRLGPEFDSALRLRDFRDAAGKVLKPQRKPLDTLGFSDRLRMQAFLKDLSIETPDLLYQIKNRLDAIERRPGQRRDPPDLPGISQKIAQALIQSANTILEKRIVLILKIEALEQNLSRAKSHLRAQRARLRRANLETTHHPSLRATRARIRSLETDRQALRGTLPEVDLTVLRLRALHTHLVDRSNTLIHAVHFHVEQLLRRR